MAGWDINKVRQLAGIPLFERYDDDDDDSGLSRAERELIKKADKDLADKGVKVPTIDPDKEVKTRVRTQVKDAADEEADAEEEKEKSAVAAKKTAETTPPKEEPEPTDEDDDEDDGEKTPAEEKKTTEATPKKRGRAVNPDSNRQRCRAWIAAHPTATRGEFITAAGNIGMGKAEANAFFYRQSVKATRTPSAKAVKEELWLVSHPTCSSFFLAENAAMGQYEWADETSTLMPLVFETEAAAQQLSSYLSNWKNQTTKVVGVTI